jgi:REP element-mobilizing transposase RayT
MSDYRRFWVPGGTYLLTVNLLERQRDTLVGCVDALREVVRATRHEWPFHIDAWVVLPDHLRACGPCRRQTMISPIAGKWSRFASFRRFREQNGARRQESRGENGVLGNGAARNMSSAMTPIILFTSIKCTGSHETQASVADCRLAVLPFPTLRMLWRVASPLGGRH